MATKKIDTVHHFDVWGNEEDGWEVNDSRRGPTLEVEEPVTQEKVWAAMVEAGEAQGEFEDAEFEEHGDGYVITEKKTGRPVWTVNDCW